MLRSKKFVILLALACILIGSFLASSHPAYAAHLHNSNLLILHHNSKLQIPHNVGPAGCPNAIWLDDAKVDYTYQGLNFSVVANLYGWYSPPVGDNRVLLFCNQIYCEAELTTFSFPNSSFPPGSLQSECDFGVGTTTKWSGGGTYDFLDSTNVPKTSGNVAAARAIFQPAGTPTELTAWSFSNQFHVPGQL